MATWQRIVAAFLLIDAYVIFVFLLLAVVRALQRAETELEAQAGPHLPENPVTHELSATAQSVSRNEAAARLIQGFEHLSA